MKAAAKIESRFQSDADKYAAYLETPEGRLRSDLAFANLEDFLPGPRSESQSRALDLGCGTGAAAVRLARLGFRVTMLDSSLPMLDIAKRAALKAGVTDQITVKHANATDLPNLFDAGSFDVILCHNLLEYVDDHVAVLRSAGRLMRGPSAIFSILVRNQTGEVLKAALQMGSLAAAENGLTAEWGNESLYGGKVRLFNTESLEIMLNEAALTMTAQRGVRVLSDYLPPQVSRNAEYDRIFALERKLGSRRELAAVARYTQCFAQPLLVKDQRV